jgi:hypothetical protein
MSGIEVGRFPMRRVDGEVAVGEGVSIPGCVVAVADLMVRVGSDTN